MTVRYFYAALAVLILASPALAGPAQENAFTTSGNPAVSSAGDCVRTKWMAESDPCAPNPPLKQEVVVVAPPPPAPEPVPEIALEQRTVYFDFNKAELKPEGAAKLDSLVGIIQNSKGIKQATVIGYADQIGSKGYNVVLSQKRADKVERYLASRVSIPTDVLMVKGKGEENSVTNCPTEMKRAERIACLAQDRRVEVEFNYAH